MINKFYLLCVIFSGSPDLTLKTCLVFLNVIPDHIDAFSPILVLVKKSRRNTPLSHSFMDSSFHFLLEKSAIPLVSLPLPSQKEHGRSRNLDCNDSRISYCVMSPTVRKCIAVLKNHASRQITCLCRWKSNWEVADFTGMGKWKLFFVNNRKCNCHIYALVGYLNSCQGGKNIWIHSGILLKYYYIQRTKWTVFNIKIISDIIYVI